ncbi:MAG: TRAP transporter substrate-binding protein DctP [Deltaproteobacteria bacterium]|nr:MAG: TRAP transporter substrate-binding protein DctP [Deltaproteobacteria bacterium]
MRKAVVCFLVAGLLVGLLYAGSQAARSAQAQTSATPGKTFKWRLVTACVEGDIIYRVGDHYLANLIEKGSGGRIKVDLYPVGPIVSLEEQVPAVVAGGVEAVRIIPGYAAGIAPATLTGECAYGTRDGYEDWELHVAWGLDKLLREHYAKGGVYYLGAPYAAMICFFSNFPINAANDFKGKKVWVSPSLMFLKEFGLVPTEMPGFDPYMAMKLGTIQGFSYSSMNLEHMKLKEVTKYIMQPSFFPASTHLIVNMKAWNALGPDLQQQLQNYLDAHLFELIPMMQKLEDDAFVKAKEYGVQFITLPPDELDKVLKPCRAGWDYVAGMHPDAAKIIELYRAWLKYNKAWEYK